MDLRLFDGDMEIREVVLQTRDTDTIERFYGRELGLEVVSDPARVTVALGSTRMVFEESEYEGAHHLAFTIPTGMFPQAKQWIAARAALLGRDGVDEFEGPSSWNSRSVYFDGPDGQVLELIERRDLRQPTNDHFGPDGLLCVSEVGVAVPEVLDTVDLLQVSGIEPYGSPPSEGFAAVGDIHGMLILVPPGRGWMPTGDRYAQGAPVIIRAVGVVATELTSQQTLSPA